MQLEYQILNPIDVLIVFGTTSVTQVLNHFCVNFQEKTLKQRIGVDQSLVMHNQTGTKMMMMMT